MYHLYYAASTFGSNKSCIGQATRAALDSGSWADQGRCICSNMGETDNWNAIDPNVVIDDAGTPWLAFGSFWSGLKMVKLTSTGARADTMLYSLANGANSRGSLEGGWIFKRCGYYYLFSSWGSCCSGAYDYNIRVGRSTTVTGPYVDQAGTSLMSGGGTLLVKGDASWTAPGHNAVITYNNKTYNVYHALKGSSSGAADPPHRRARLGRQRLAGLRWALAPSSDHRGVQTRRAGARYSLKESWRWRPIDSAYEDRHPGAVRQDAPESGGSSALCWQAFRRAPSSRPGRRPSVVGPRRRVRRTVRTPRRWRRRSPRDWAPIPSGAHRRSSSRRS